MRVTVQKCRGVEGFIEGLIVAFFQKCMHGFSTRMSVAKLVKTNKSLDKSLGPQGVLLEYVVGMQVLS